MNNKNTKINNSIKNISKTHFIKEYSLLTSSIEKMINNYVYVNNDCISQSICNKIIDLVDMQPNKYHGSVGSGVNKKVKNTIDYSIPIVVNDIEVKEILENHFRNNPRSVSFTFKKINENIETKLWKNISKMLMNTLIKNISIYINNNLNNYSHLDIFSSNEPYFFEVLQYQKYYKNNGIFTYHTDDSSYVNNNKIFTRVLTYIFYLNDVEEGGETVVWDFIHIKPEKGRLLLFPACWTFPHKGNLPISNDKHIITGWVYKEVIK